MREDRCVTPERLPGVGHPEKNRVSLETAEVDGGIDRITRGPPAAC